MSGKRREKTVEDVSNWLRLGALEDAEQCEPHWFRKLAELIADYYLAQLDREKEKA